MSENVISEDASFCAMTISLMLEALDTHRTLEIVAAIEPRLPSGQISLLRRFLSWCKDGSRSLCYANFEQVFTEFRAGSMVTADT